MNTLTRGTLVLVLISLVGLGGWLGPFVINQGATGDQFDEQRVFIRTDGRVTEATLYLPKSADPVPGIVYGAGSGSEPAMYSGVGETLARNGFAVLIPGPTYDLEPGRPVYWMIVREEAALWNRGTENYLNWIEFLEAHPRVDADRLVIGGHSGGANGAYRAAYERPDIDGLVAIAGRFPPNRSSPLATNVFLATGSEDSLVPPSRLANISEPLTGAHLDAGDQVGSFQNGTAARLYVAEGASHLTEPFHPALIQETTDWALQSVGEPPSEQVEVNGRAPQTVLLQFVFGLVSVIALAILVHRHADLFEPARLRPFLPSGAALGGFITVVTTTISADLYHLSPVLPELRKYGLLFAIVVALATGIHRALVEHSWLSSGVRGLTLDLVFVVTSIVSFVLLSTQFVTFQLVTTAVLSMVFLALLAPVMILLVALDLERLPRWLFSGLAVVWFYPAIVPPYM